MRTVKHVAFGVIVLLAMSGEALAQEAAGVTDLTNADPEVIMASDLVSALAVQRGTKINPKNPPLVRTPIYFEFGTAEPTAPSRALLEQVSLALGSEDLKPFRFEISGHTDSIGSDEYNKTLSERRAAAVRAYLEGRGTDPSRLDMIGRGESDPIQSNDTEEGRRRNRRVDFVNLGTATR